MRDYYNMNQTTLSIALDYLPEKTIQQDTSINSWKA